MNAIELKNVSFRYPNGTLANEEINLTIKQGERVAIIGQNGAGKTTVVKMMNGLHKPTSGEVWVDGVSTANRTTAQVSASVGYVFQNPDDQIFHTTVQKEIEFWPEYNKLSPDECAARVNRAVKMTGIESYFKLNPYEIPYSTKKFVTIASVLVAQTPYVVLDEPTAGQDMLGIKHLVEIMDVLHDEGKTVVTISHDMEFVASYFDRVVVMANKHIIADGPPQEIFQNRAILEQAKVKRPQIGQLADRLGYPTILFSNELINKLN